jgi:hypothetical protein
MTQDQVITLVTRFKRINKDCPLPVDLAAAVEAVGLDIDLLCESIENEEK